MTTTTSEAVVQEWADAMNGGAALVEALGLTPCEGLHTLFPAIVGDDTVMEALAEMLDPVAPFAAALEGTGVIPPGEGVEVVHDLFHLLQIAAGLGHMLGVADAMGMAGDVPDLDSIVWDDLPDVFADDLASRGVPTTTPDDSAEESGSEES